MTWKQNLNSKLCLPWFSSEIAHQVAHNEIFQVSMIPIDQHHLSPVNVNLYT